MGGSAEANSIDFFTHNNQLQIWLLASPVARLSPIRTAPLHPNTMGDAPTPRFGWNQRWGRVIGGVLPSELNQFFYTQQSTGLWLLASPVTWLPVAVATVALAEALVVSGGNGGRGRGHGGGRGDDGGSG